MTAGLLSVLGALVAVPCERAGADDVVFLASEDNPDGAARLSGTVVEYTGKELILESADGRRRNFPGRRVQRIESEWSAEQLAGESLFREHQFQAAASQFQSAGRIEERRWVRRRLIANLVDCHRHLGQFDRAGELFLLLVREDPDTPYFASLPLAWLPQEPSGTLEAKASAWLEDELPCARLLGASHLLTGASREKAIRALDELATGDDDRIAALADAQAWRASLATVPDEELARWTERLSTIPGELRAGPYFVLGKALAQRGRHEEAALSFLRVPILHPDEYLLAAEALWEAGRAQEAIGAPEGAEIVYRELIDQFEASRAAALGAERLRALATP